MELARVVGNVVATVKNEALQGVRLLLVQPEDHEGNPQGGLLVAADPLQAGVGDRVAWIQGREAAMALPKTFAPVDCAIVQIVDHAWGDAEKAGVTR